MKKVHIKELFLNVVTSIWTVMLLASFLVQNSVPELISIYMAIMRCLKVIPNLNIWPKPKYWYHINYNNSHTNTCEITFNKMKVITSSTKQVQNYWSTVIFQLELLLQTVQSHPFSVVLTLVIPWWPHQIPSHHPLPAASAEA